MPFRKKKKRHLHPLIEIRAWVRVKLASVHETLRESRFLRRYFERARWMKMT